MSCRYKPLYNRGVIKINDFIQRLKSQETIIDKICHLLKPSRTRFLWCFGFVSVLLKRSSSSSICRFSHNLRIVHAFLPQHNHYYDHHWHDYRTDWLLGWLQKSFHCELQFVCISNKIYMGFVQFLTSIFHVYSCLLN